MKNLVVFSIVLLIFSLAASLSYALATEEREAFLTEVMLEHDNSLMANSVSEKIYYLNDYNKTLDKQFVLHGEEIKGSPMINGKGVDFLSNPDINRLKTHQPLVNNFSVISSLKNIKTPSKSSVLDLEFSSILSEAAHGGVLQVGAAFLTNFALHELGHVVVGDYVGVKGTEFGFLKKHEGQFFLGHTTYEQIDANSKLSYSMGGEVAVDLTFEHALQSYRKNPTTYNKSLLFFSATDFLWYSAYAFYLSGGGNSHFDPVSISEQTGISKDMIFAIALAKTMANAYRVYSGQDRVVPYFTVDKNSAILNIGIAF